MVKIKIARPGAAVAVDYEEAEAEELFKDLTAKLLGIKRSDAQSVSREYPAPITTSQVAENKAAPSPAKVSKIAPAQKAAENVGLSDHKNSGPHSGFLYIKCGHCGSERAYCQKAPTKYSVCTKCGSRTYFADSLKQIFVSCECGQKSRYLTNMSDDMFDIQCVNCKAPVAVKYNQKMNCYETIR